MADSTMADRIYRSVRERFDRLWWLALFVVAKYSLQVWLAAPSSDM
jgi:hypothetical protein